MVRLCKVCTSHHQAGPHTCQTRKVTRSFHLDLAKSAIMARSKIFAPRRTQASSSKPSKNDVANQKAASVSPAKKPTPKKAKIQLERNSPPPDSDSGSEDADSDEEEGDGGVDEEGMKKLIEALGDDGLDEMGGALLNALQAEDAEDSDEVEGEDEDSDEDEEGNEVEEGAEEAVGEENASEDEDEKDEDEDEDEEVALDDVSSVDEDAVPMQKITVNNEVSSLTFFFCTMQTSLSSPTIGSSSPNSRYHPTRSLTPVDRDSYYHITGTYRSRR